MSNEPPFVQGECTECGKTCNLLPAGRDGAMICGPCGMTPQHIVSSTIYSLEFVLGRPLTDAQKSGIQQRYENHKKTAAR